MTTAPPLLEIDNLCIDFGAKRVVDHVSLTVGVGEKVGLVGESGSGKSITVSNAPPKRSEAILLACNRPAHSHRVNGALAGCSPPGGRSPCKPDNPG